MVLGAAGPANLRPNIEARQQAANAFAEGLRNVLDGFRASGLTQRDMVAELNRLGVRTSTGRQWHLTSLQRILSRLAA
ncbi:recombinase-like helix-turn-helix domain-containing protein [Pararobbsia silviterrae]|uniref:recombinase-like helix-turn-helix domain-containing protein n=1 Tax=Pararobbsia silviterrae TaxID=1792498 RepID=UPI0030B82B84